ncbi:Ly6g6e [Phodopus roborovskii]|uniref:Ly6g6e protein n=1 Tax=Phodopus roborovskii TaxID=109678 RepID=A0AAU9ZDF8_PHORO|nr:Ly6g6e [Phodopus roborovskii]
MGLSRAFLCILFLSGALGLTTSPTRGRLQCYTCSFAKPCYPVLTECQEDEVCGISVGTSGRTLVQWSFFRWRLTSLFSATQPQRSFVPQTRRRRTSLNGRAASPGPSAPCWAMPPTGHSLMLSNTSVVTRTYAMLLPHGDSQAFPSPPCFSLPGEHTSFSSL